MRKRDKLKIVYDILKAIQDKNHKIRHTHILYKSNLSYGVLQQYLGELLLKNMVVEHMQDDKRLYGLTDRGFEYINRYGAVRNFNEVFGLAEEGKY